MNNYFTPPKLVTFLDWWSSTKWGSAPDSFLQHLSVVPCFTPWQGMSGVTFPPLRCHDRTLQAENSEVARSKSDTSRANSSASWLMIIGMIKSRLLMIFDACWRLPAAPFCTTKSIPMQFLPQRHAPLPMLAALLTNANYQRCDSETAWSCSL